MAGRYHVSVEQGVGVESTLGFDLSTSSLAYDAPRVDAYEYPRHDAATGQIMAVWPSVSGAGWEAGAIDLITGTGTSVVSLSFMTHTLPKVHVGDGDDGVYHVGVVSWPHGAHSSPTQVGS